MHLLTITNFSLQRKNRLSLLVCLEHPLSRGTVHITSSDPTKAPRIEPGYLRNNVDAKILAEGIKWMDKVAKQPILAKSLGARIQPPEGASIESEDERVNFVKNHISTQYHLIGTCTMGEVVDDTLKVKGAKNLRVIDASVFPGHVSGSTYTLRNPLLESSTPANRFVFSLLDIMASTYAVAEKGADLVKADDGRF